MSCVIRILDIIKILDLRCGNNKRLGAIGVDFSDRHDTDVIHDLNIFPYPLLDAKFDEVFLDNVLEHLDQPIMVMEEVYRLCKRNGRVTVIAPYFRSVWAFIDPNHLHFFTVESFAYDNPCHPICNRYEYTQTRFFVDKITFKLGSDNRFFKRPIIRLANCFPNKYEYYFSHLFPFDDMTYDLIRC